MPNFDGTGPDGKGPKTGCGLGRCQDSYENIPMGMGRGCGNNRQGFGGGRRGFGGGGGGFRGMCRRFFQNSQASLEEEEKILEERLAEIRKIKNESK